VLVNANDDIIPEWAGTQQLGTIKDERGSGIVVNSSGDIYITGWSVGPLDGFTQAGGQDMFITKYSSSGTNQWTKKIGTASVDDGKSISVDSNDNIYVAGYTGAAFDGNNHFGGEDGFLVKYDSNGNKQFSVQIGSSNFDQACCVTVDSNNYIYISGYTTGSIDGNQSNGSVDIFLMKFDSSGNKIWTKQYGTNQGDQPYGMSIDLSDNIYITGNTSGQFDGNSSAGLYDMFLLKYNSDGEEDWAKQLGTTGSDSGEGVTVDSEGNVYVTGSTDRGLDGQTSYSAIGNNDVFLVKYNSNGLKQWSQQIGSSESDDGNGISIDLSGNIYITGMTKGSFDGEQFNGNEDIFLVKYNSNGIKQWSQQFGTSDDEFGMGVAVNQFNEILITGSTKGHLDGNTLSGGEDVFLIKYNSEGIKQ